MYPYKHIYVHTYIISLVFRYSVAVCAEPNNRFVIANQQPVVESSQNWAKGDQRPSKHSLGSEDQNSEVGERHRTLAEQRQRVWSQYRSNSSNNNNANNRNNNNATNNNDNNKNNDDNNNNKNSNNT